MAAQGEMWRRQAVQMSQVRQFGRGWEVTVEFLCKNCGKKFKRKLYFTSESVNLTEEEKGLELNTKCPKCKSPEVKMLGDHVSPSLP